MTLNEKRAPGESQICFFIHFIIIDYVLDVHVIRLYMILRVLEVKKNHCRDSGISTAASVFTKCSAVVYTVDSQFIGELLCFSIITLRTSV